MRTKKLFRLISAAVFTVGITAAVSASAGELFDNLFFFGDSLSDVGNSTSAPVTNPGGSTWAKYFGTDYGINVQPSNQGGTDYAWAGAQTGSYYPPPPYGPNPPVPPTVMQQVNTYLSNTGGVADKHALYSIWAGANNINDELPFLLVQYLTAGGTNPTGFLQTQAGPFLTLQVSNDITQLVQQLHAAGARYIMVLNLPDLGLTPAGQGTIFGPTFATALSLISASTNDLLTAKLSNIGFNVIQLDIYSLFHYLLANGPVFGFTNVTTPFVGSGATNPNQFLFYDTEHPTAAGQQIVADYAFATIQAPIFAGVLGQAPFSVFDSQTANMESQLYAIRTGIANLPDFGNSFIADFNYHAIDPNSDSTQFPGYNTYGENFAAGLIHRFNCNFNAGIDIAKSYNTVNVGEHTGSFNLNENLGSVFGTYTYGPFYADAIADGGVVDFNNIHRQFQLGIANETAYAETSGEQIGGDLILGYNILNCAIKTGPIVNADYQYLTVDPYAEAGAPPGTDMQYSAQYNQSFVTGYGWQGSYTVDLCNFALMPFAQATFDNEWLNNNNNRFVKAGVLTLPGSNFTIPIAGPDRDFGILTAGLFANVTHNVTVGVSYDALLANDGDTQNVSANLQVLI